LAQETQAASAVTRLRAVDAEAAALLAAGKARSATFRILTDRIEYSDLVVYVESRQMTLPGQVRFASGTPGVR
jgi:hypothetical protein